MTVSEAADAHEKPTLRRALLAFCLVGALCAAFVATRTRRAIDAAPVAVQRLTPDELPRFRGLRWVWPQTDEANP